MNPNARQPPVSAARASLREIVDAYLQDAVAPYAGKEITESEQAMIRSIVTGKLAEFTRSKGIEFRQRYEVVLIGPGETFQTHVAGATLTHRVRPECMALMVRDLQTDQLYSSADFLLAFMPNQPIQE